MIIIVNTKEPEMLIAGHWSCDLEGTTLATGLPRVKKGWEG